MRDLRLAISMGAAIALLAGCSRLAGGLPPSLDGEWVLQTGTHQGQAIPIVSNARITLKIDGTQAGGTAACNSYGGTVQVDGASIAFSELIQTEMACVDDAAMASEAAYLAALPLVTTAAREGSSLVLGGSGVELHYTLAPPVPDAALVGPLWVLDSLIHGDTVSSTVGERVTLQLNGDGTLSASTGCRTVTARYTVAGNRVDVTLDPYDTIGCPNEVGDQDAQVLTVLGDGFEFAIQGSSLTLTARDQGLGYRTDAAS